MPILRAKVEHIACVSSFAYNSIIENHLLFIHEEISANQFTAIVERKQLHFHYWFDFDGIVQETILK